MFPFTPTQFMANKLDRKLNISFFTIAIHSIIKTKLLKINIVLDSLKQLHYLL